MKLAKFRKEPADVKRYVVDYEDWLDIDETLVGVTMGGNVELDEFYVEGWAVEETGKRIVYFVSGGLPRTDYTVTIAVTTSKGQVKNDTISISVM